jgi:hypothetical protein
MPPGVYTLKSLKSDQRLSSSLKPVVVTFGQALEFIQRHGIVLESATGPVPSLAQTIAGGNLKGSWWSHPMGKDIFQITRAVRASEQVLVCRLVAGKVTFVHARLWPALVRAAGHFRAGQLSQLIEEHTESGKHLSKEIPFPAWVPVSVTTQAGELSEEQALNILESIVPGVTFAHKPRKDRI